MANQIAIIGRIIEALKARGFTDNEAWQMLRRVQRGDKIPDPPDQDAINAAYKRGLEDGRNQMMQQASGGLYNYQAQFYGQWARQNSMTGSYNPNPYSW
jgi:hypothetical protein